MKILFVFCENDLEVLLNSLPESDELAYFFFSEVKVLNIAIKQKKPDALLFKGAEFTKDILNCISNNDNTNSEKPIILLGKASSIASIPHFKIYSLPDRANETELHKLFSDIKLINKKPALSKNSTKTQINELGDNNQLLDLLMAHIPDAVYFKDRKSRYTKINYPEAAILQVSAPEDVVGKTDKDFFPPDQSEKFFKEEQAFMKRGIPLINNIECINIFGEEKYLSATKAPLIDSDGKCIGLVGITRDVTNQCLIEKELLVEKEFMDLLMNNLPDRIYFKDKKSRFIRCSMALARIFEVSSPEELYGKTDFDFHDPIHAKEAFEDEQKIMKSRKPLLNKRESYTKNGERFWELTTKIPIINDQNEVVGLFGISHDFTTQMRLEEKLEKEKVKAEEANKAKSLFLATMSHEIRTPMNGIIGMADILSKSKLEPNQREYLEIIIKSGQTLLSLINDILDFSKIESGKMELEIAPINIRSIIEEVADIQVVHALEKSIDLLTYVDPEVPEFVGGDYVRLKQIITNLVNNAIKFTLEGEVVIHINYIAESNGVYEIQFRVKDSGIGITKEDQKKLFKSFSQVDASTTRKFGGSGLGLAISQRLVKQMGGNLELDSSINNGTTFFFNIKLPVSQANKENKNNGVPLSTKQLYNKHIAIVDDNETNRRIFRNYLETWNVKVTELKDGIEALSFFKGKYIAGDNEPIDLVLVDFQMPGMDGEELAKQIKLDKRICDLKLVLLSSITDAIPTKKINDAGFEAGLNKPIKMNQLLNVILQVLGMQQEQEILQDIENENQILIYKNTRFLIVEDNPINIRVAKIMLSELSPHVEVANNGLEAVDLFKTNEFDIILMDIRMPVMDGVQATIKIRELEKGSKKEKPVKIIAMTANTFQEDIENCMANGMDAFLEKPFKRKDLVYILTKVM